MQIVILNWRDIRHPLAGGAEISLLEHAKYWKKKGAKLTWISAQAPGLADREVINGIEYIRLGSQYTVHMRFLFGFLRGVFPQPDIIIDSFHFLPFFTPLYAGKTKIIALINETAKEAWLKNLLFPFGRIGYMIEPLFFQFYKRTPFITGSESAVIDVAAMGIPKEHITLIHHGVTVPKLKKTFKKEANPTVIFLSRLASDKGIEDAIHAVSVLRRKLPDVSFWIVGKAEQEQYLDKIKQLIIMEKIAKMTTFFGFVSEQKKVELLQRGWVLVHPSVREGWGLTVIEANAVNTPTVGYNVAGLKDSIVNGRTGLLVPQSPERLADALYTLLTDKKMYTQMSREAGKWAGTFNWEKSGKESWQLIRTIYEQ